MSIQLDCKTVRIFAYSSKREQSNKRSGTRLKTESETGKWRTATSTHFTLCSLHFTIFTIFHTETTIKFALEFTGYSVKIRSQVQTITRAILPRNQSPSVSNSQRGWSCEQFFWQLDDIFKPPGQNELIVCKTDSRFFSLPSQARALRARKTDFSDFFLLILGKKTDRFAV